MTPEPEDRSAGQERPPWIAIDSKDMVCIYCHRRGVLEYRTEPSSTEPDDRFIDVIYRCRVCGKEDTDVQLRDDKTPPQPSEGTK